MATESSKFECYVGDKRFTLLCDSDTQLWQFKEALFQFMKHAGRMEESIVAQVLQEEALKEAVQIEEVPSPENTEIQA